MIDLERFRGVPAARLLARLIEAEGERVEIEALARAAPLGREKILEILGRLPGGIDATSRGYRLPLPGGRLDRAAAEGAIAGTRWERVTILPAVTSTNDVALALGEAGEGEQAVVTETQVQGRGRRGRSWVSPPGHGIWASVLSRPQRSAGPVYLVTVAAAIAAVRAARAAAGVGLLIKWPNDLVAPGPAGSGGRKVGGILAEGRWRGAELDFAVVGVGINVFPWPATGAEGGRSGSLAEMAPAEVDRDRVLRELLRELDRALTALESGRGPGLVEEFRAASNLLGEAVRIEAPGGPLAGIARDFDPDGALVVERSDGSRVRVLAGEATLAREVG